MFWKESVIEKINLQREGNRAKPYQVKQVRNIIVGISPVEQNMYSGLDLLLFKTQNPQWKKSRIYYIQKQRAKWAWSRS